MWYVYVLLSKKTGETYKGITESIEKRLFRHEKGQSKFAKIRLPLKLIYVEIVNSRAEARKLEKFLKSGYGREIIKQIVAEQRLMPEW